MCGHGLYQEASLVICIRVYRKKSLIQGQAWQARNLLTLYNHAHPVRCSPASGLYRGSGSCAGIRLLERSKQHRISLDLQKSAFLVLDIEKVRRLYFKLIRRYIYILPNIVHYKVYTIRPLVNKLHIYNKGIVDLKEDQFFKFDVFQRITVYYNVLSYTFHCIVLLV